MKIKKYAGGSVIYTPSVYYTPSTKTQTESGEDSEVKAKKSDLADYIIDTVKAGGLDNDVQAFLAQADRILMQAHANPSSNMTDRQLVQLAKLAVNVKNNKAQWDTAEKTISAEKAWYDPATTNDGRMYVQDNETGKIEKILPNSYDPQLYTYLTTQDLLQLRRMNSSYTFDAETLRDISGVRGTEAIVTWVNEMIEKFGKTTLEGPVQKEAGKIKTGLALLKDSTPTELAQLLQGAEDGSYKYKSETTYANSAEDLKLAIDYLYKWMPNDIKHTLQAKATIERDTPKYMMMQLACMQNDSSFALTSDSSSKSKNGDGELTGSVQHTLAETYATGANGAEPELLQIAPEDSSVPLWAYGQQVGPVVYANGENPGNPMRFASVSEVMEKAYGIRSVSNNTLAFGDQVIDPEQWSGIVYDGSDMRRIVLPAKRVNGGKDIVPDFELQTKLDELMNDVESGKIAPDMIDRYLNNLCPGATFNPETGEILLPESNKHAFLTFGAEASTDFVSLNTDSKYINKNTNRDADIYREAVTYGVADHSKDAKPKITALEGHLFRSTKRNMYVGNVYIPISSKVMGSTMHNQGYLPKSKYVNVTGQAIEQSRQQQMKNRLSNEQNLTWSNG